MKKKTKITLTILGSLLVAVLVIAIYIAHVVHKSIDDYYFPKKESSIFPELIPTGGLPEGYNWELSDGPDFYIYRGNGTSTNAGVGIYFGMHPNVKEEQPPRIENGSLGDLPVQWEVFDGFSNYPAFYRRCLTPFKLSLKHETISVHAWVFAGTKPEAVALQNGLKGLMFKETSYAERTKANQSTHSITGSAGSE